MATENGVLLNTAEELPRSLTDTAKVLLCAWLYKEYHAKVDPERFISSIDNYSEQLIKRKIAILPIWEITNPSVFTDVYKKAVDNKFFRIMDRKTYLAFVRDGKLFLKFLKSKPNFHANSITKGMASSDDFPSATNTINAVIIKVLKEEVSPLTDDEIYTKIVEQGLYTFGSHNPLKVIRKIIENASDNPGYSGTCRVSEPVFHIDRNHDGRRIYRLIHIDTQDNSLARKPNVVSPKVADSSELIIWSSKIEHDFQKWLEHEKFAQRTANNYRRAAAQIFRTYTSLAKQAVGSSLEVQEAVRNYITLLNNDNGFVEANATRHNQFTAALTALERFYASGTRTANRDNDEQLSKQPESTGVISSSISSTIDIEVGKAGIKEILEVHFQTLYGYSNISILWNAVQDNLSLFLNDNAINTADELWDFMNRVFSEDYVMSSPHIWEKRPDHPHSNVGVIINLARQLGGTVTRGQIDDYFTCIKLVSPTNATVIRHGLLMFYASKHFILTEAVDMTNERCTAIKKALDGLFDREKVSYIVLRDITTEWFSSLPRIYGSLNWTAHLLQEVLRLRPSIGYRVIFSGLDGQSLDTLGAAIVPSKSVINSFVDVVHHFCYDKGILGNKMVAEDLRVILRGAGMLEGNELVYNLHKALRDYRFAFSDENRMVKILER